MTETVVSTKMPIPAPTTSAEQLPLVSVVIPTKGRPSLLERAIASVMNQTYCNFEIVVVVDGPDPATCNMLAGLGDARVTSMVNPVSVGGAEARNVGVRAARGKWVAFLDDDDEWMPTKLQRQIDLLTMSPVGRPVGYSRVVARAPSAEFVFPRKLYDRTRHMSDYMLARNSLFSGEGLVQTSTIVAPRDLMLEQPFDRVARSYQETDWLLRVANLPETDFVAGEDPLVVWHIEDGRESITASRTWQYSLDWIDARRSLVTPRAYAAFLLVQVASLAAQAGNRHAALGLFWKAVRHGRPAPIDLFLFCGVVLVPFRFRRWMRSIVVGRRRG